MPALISRPRSQRSIPTRTVIYAWKGGGGKVAAQIVGEELERLEIKPGDYHKTKDVLEAARAPDSPLHPCFEWDDAEASELYRLQQCRNILRSIAVITVDANNKRQKKNCYIHVTDAEGPRYVKTDRVANDDEIRQRAIDEALSLLNGLRRRFDFISELKPIFEAVAKIRQRRRK